MAGGEDEAGRIELAEERLEVGTCEVERGRVVIRTRVETREAMVEAELRRDEVEVERVPIGRPVDVAPTAREEGDVLIVPVLEEQIVVTRRLILKEELHVRRQERVETHREPVQVRSEHADVTREPPQHPEQPQASNEVEPDDAG